MARRLARNATVAVDTTAVAVAPERDRISIYLRNSSTAGQTITLVCSDTQTATVLAGMPLKQGDFIIDSDNEKYECWDGNISAISDVAGAVLSVYERIRVK